MRRYAYPAHLRLKQRRDFLRVQRGGAKHHLPRFIAFVSRRRSTRGEGQGEELPPTRLGITVTRKIGNAVTRNRIKRLVREVFRLHREQLPPGLDLVLVAKQQAAGASYADVQADFEALVARGPRLAQRKPRSRSKSKPKSKPKPKPKTRSS